MIAEGGAPPGRRLSLCMIVRDEEETVARCLESVRGVPDEIIVVDTGSVDRTAEICRALGATVHTYRWNDDFAAARNFALELAGGDWVLALDADDEVDPADRPRLRALLEADGVEGFLFQTLSYIGDRPGEEIVVCPHLRLFRHRPGRRYTGAIHERLEVGPDARLVYRDVKVHHYGYLTSLVRGQSKLGRNMAICRRAAVAHPGDPFAHFNLGTEYLRSGNHVRALGSFLRARDLVRSEAGWAPELEKKLTFCLMRLKRYDQARRELAWARAQYPEYTDLVFLEAGLCQETGDGAGAAAAFRRCLEMGEAPAYHVTDRGVGTFKAAFGLGYALAAQKDYPAAAEAYLLALQQNPRYGLPLVFLVEALAEWLSPAGALDYLLERIEVSGPVMDRLARAFVAGGYYREGLTCLERAGLERGGGADDGILRGLCHLGLGEITVAQECFLAVGEDDPLRAQALLNLCLGEWVRDPPGDAAGYLEALRRMEGGAGHQVYRRFNALLSADQSSAAAAASRGGGGRPCRETVLNLAEKLAELRSPAKALLALSMLGPDLQRPGVAIRAGKFLARWGHHAAAREVLLGATAAAAGGLEGAGRIPVEHRAVLADVELRLGHFCRAAALFRRALAVAGERHAIAAHHGLAAALRGQARVLADGAAVAPKDGGVLT